jgi:hypothetical protein
LLGVLERSNATWFARLYRLPSPTRRDRLSTPPTLVLTLALCLWLFVGSYSLGSTSISPAIVATTLVLDAAAVWYWGTWLRWPYNALGFLLVSDSESSKDVPRDVAIIKQLVTDEWELRFGQAITQGTEQVWRIGRRCTWLTLDAVLLGASGLPLIGHGLWSLVPALALPLLVWLILLRAQKAAETERVRQQISTRLAIPRFDDFPSLIPDDYQRWLQIRSAPTHP